MWAIDETHAPLYWFPRDCPRGSVWAHNDAEQDLLRERCHTTAPRLHVTELAWLDRIRRCTLYVYRLPPGPFEPWPDAAGQWVSRNPVAPLAVEPVGDLLDWHAAAGIELRFTTNVWPFWDEVVASGLPFSGVRLANAAPRRSGHG